MKIRPVHVGNFMFAWLTLTCLLVGIGMFKQLPHLKGLTIGMAGSGLIIMATLIGIGVGQQVKEDRMKAGNPREPPCR